MSDSGDSYAGYNDFADLTEEDLLALEAPGPSNRASTSELPDFAPDAEPETISALKEPGGQEGNDMGPDSCVATDLLPDIEDAVAAPAALYRRQGIFSVSDLCAPSWCEVQFDYGLRGKRSRPLKDRPRSFKSSKGKEITVAREVEAKNDERTKGGKEIHKELEREIMAEPVYVKVTCDEEKWALRLVNLMVNLQQMMVMGITRETPVFGIVHDEVVVGIIDEIHMKPREVQQTPKTPQGKRARAPLSPSQNTIDRYMSPKRSQSPYKTELASNGCSDIAPAPKYTLNLVDTKTRTTHSTPSHEDALPSRIQLMLYHRILSDLLSTSPSFDFAHLWATLDLDPYRPFPTTILRDTGMLQPAEDGPLCLADVVELWWKLRDELHAEVASQLQLVYRLIPEGKRPGRRGKGWRRESSFQEFEDKDLARAIQASLDDLSNARATPADDSENDLIGATTVEVEHKTIPATEAAASDPTVCSDGDSGAPSSPPPLEVVGTKVFNMDDALLDAHVESVLQWWRGERAPQGVPVELARRCYSCEYMKDCEWREAKALEAKQKLELKKTSSAS